MIVPPLWLSPGITYDLGWALIHFLWQGLVLAAILQTILPMCRNAAQRHNWALAILAMMAVAPVLTFLFIQGHQSAGALAAADANYSGLGGSGIMMLQAPISFGWIDLLVALWGAGILVLSLRAMGGWYLVEMMWRQDAFAVPAGLLQRCRDLQNRLALARPVLFLQSCRVNAPVVIGWFRPVILIPAAAVTGLPPQQLDALVMHELAHIRRFDTFTNIMLVIVETMLFYHPAVWWVGRRVRIEREHCCDDFAVAMCGDAAIYVEALTSLKSAKAMPVLVLAASGGKLKDRVARLLDVPANSRKISPAAVMGLLFLAAIATTAATARDSKDSVTGDKPQLALRTTIAAKMAGQKTVLDENSGTANGNLPLIGPEDARQAVGEKKRHFAARETFQPAASPEQGPPQTAQNGSGQNAVAAVPAMDSQISLNSAAPVAQQAPATANVRSTVERIVVTAPRWMGDRPETAIHNFVNSYAMAATSTVGEISRWKLGICARTYGLSKPEYDQFVTDRIDNIAVDAGVGLKSGSCRYNVEIVFTAQPQQFLDRVRAEGAQLLGPRPSQAVAVSQMRYPVQAWYATGTRDVYGSLVLDDEDGGDAGFRDAGNGGLGVFATTPTRHVEGFHWRTGLNSELAHIYVIADTSRTQGMELGAVADYVAVLALSQTQNFDACKPIPSITNLIAPACAAELKPKALTDADLAYLKAIYTMDPGANLKQQQNFISASIARSLGVK